MQIEIITTPNKALKESGFGTLKACKSVLDVLQRMGYSVRLNVCETKEHLDEVVKRKPELVILAVKYIPVNNKDEIAKMIFGCLIILPAMVLITQAHQEKR